jgi:hypothetical protein
VKRHQQQLELFHGFCERCSTKLPDDELRMLAEAQQSAELKES